MTFLHPVFLWLLPGVALIWLLPRRGVAPRHGLLRTFVLATLLVALARPVSIRSAWTDHHVVIVDRTPSVRSAAAVDAALRAVTAKLPPGGVRVLVEVGAPPPGGQPPRPAGFDRRVVVGDANASPLGAALELALREIPEGAAGAVTLISDGLSTDPRWGRALQELTLRGLPLHAVAVAGRRDDVRPVALDVPDPLRVGHTGRVRVTVAAGDARVRVVLRADDAELARSPEVHCVDRAVVTLETEPPRAGTLRLCAELEVLAGADEDPTNNALARAVAVQGPLDVLYLGDRVTGAAPRLAQLLGNGFAVREPAASRPLDLSTTDLVVLDDRPAATVPESWQQAIATAVRERGTGLFLSGGRGAFGPGGWHDTAIEAIAPVEFVQKEEKKDPSTALAVVIDTSGSMVGNRMTLAKEVARLAIRRLQPHDKVGIVEFYGTKTWAAPMQSAANSIDLQRALNRLGAQGGTVLFPAVEEAYYALENVQTRHKHVLIITDAGVESGPYEALLRKMHEDGIAVSTVLVGPGRHSEFLVELADWGGGRYYNSPDRFNLPELLLKKPSTSMLPSYRQGVFAVEAGHGPGWWGAVDPTGLPPLRSLVETTPRPGASVLLSVQGSGRPTLTTWQYGLGRVTALCTEPVGPGTQPWQSWPGYGPFLGRVLARTALSAQEPFTLHARRDDRRLFVEAVREVRRPLVPTARSAGLDVALDEVAPGVFRGAVAAPAGADVEVRFAAEDGWTRALVSAPLDARSPETQVDPARALPLDRAATATGGRFVPTGATVPPLSTARTGAPLEAFPLWPWFVLASLLAFVADVFWRRRGGARGRIA